MAGARSGCNSMLFFRQFASAIAVLEESVTEHSVGLRIGYKVDGLLECFTLSSVFFARKASSPLLNSVARARDGQVFYGHSVGGSAGGTGYFGVGSLSKGTRSSVTKARGELISSTRADTSLKPRWKCERIYAAVAQAELAFSP